ncbi:protein jag [Vulgatibacter incomptus]|uniref:RNA-binding protein Jag n=1 Tax=Vulgatibacter incomptus TaxID=1391653 RepID=A0A0K1PHH5_9BACT|nr:R3H domain-containing nucleic acid-binding protein [Vulgatibacter incomptus]AKU92851.1 RNA-binding protein Jag [Vulgatibacter incomptus]
MSDPHRPEDEARDIEAEKASPHPTPEAESAGAEARGGAEASAEDEAGMPEGGGEGEPGVGGAATAPEKLLRTKEVIEGILERLGAEAQVSVRDTAESVNGELRFAKGAEVLDLAPRGQMLEVVQYLVNRIVNRDAEGRKRIVLTLAGSVTEEGDEAMSAMAQRLALAARRMGRSLTLVPIHARDRKAIHVALAQAEGIQTRSEGEGNLRRLVVEPKASS